MDAQDGEAGPAELGELVRAVATRLAAADVPSPRADAELIAGHVLGLTRGGVAAAALTGRVVDPVRAARITSLARRREAREPLQHLTGVAAFRGLELAVGPGVFIPRPETEVVAQVALDALAASSVVAPVVVDLGTGSGALALAIAHEAPHARVVAVERAPAAVRAARANAERLGLAVRVVEADLADAARALGELVGTVTLVVSNPPYVPEGAVPRDPEVRDHDPREALYSGPDGLDAMRAVAGVARRLAAPGGLLVVEHGDRQGSAVCAVLAAEGWRGPTTVRDLTGRDRATIGRRPAADPRPAMRDVADAAG